MFSGVKMVKKCIGGWAPLGSIALPRLCSWTKRKRGKGKIGEGKGKENGREGEREKR